MCRLHWACGRGTTRVVYVQRMRISTASGVQRTFSLGIPQQLHMLPTTSDFEQGHTPCAGCSGSQVAAAAAEGHMRDWCPEQAGAVHHWQAAQVQGVHQPARTEGTISELQT